MSSKFQFYNLLEVYHELGEYQFKVVLSSRNFKNGHDIGVDLVDSNGRPMQFQVECWGRKLNVKFKIDQQVADGVSVVRIIRGTGKEIGRGNFWVIKP